VSIGTGYPNTTSPTNGLIVQGSVGIGTGVPVGTSAAEVYGNHLVLLDPSNTPSAGTGTIVAGSTDNAGGVTVSAATSSVITFSHPWDHTPHCTASNSTSAGAPYISASSTTAITLNFASTTGVISYLCF
jgi:hypothetical protein